MRDADFDIEDDHAKRQKIAGTSQVASDLEPTLYLVGTPIGNLEDITLRALRILKGARVALVSDAGMPGISDPGYRLVTLAIRHQIPVVPVPGASAFLAALVASGLPTDSFRFSGFLPAKRGERRAALEEIKNSLGTQVFYEAPHRILETLADVVEVLGSARNVVVAREVTKLHEEFLRLSAAEVLEQLKTRETVKGEITLLIGKAEEKNVDAAAERTSVRQRVQQIMAEEKIDEKAALKRVAKERGISKSEAYREMQREK